MSNHEVSQTPADGSNNPPKAKKSRTKEIIFISSLAGMSTLMGFSATLTMAKKKDTQMFNKGLIASHELPRSGSSLAVRALGWGSLCAVSGVSLFCFAVLKLMGVHSMDEFTAKMQSMMPKVPKKEQQGRTEFRSLRELFQYLMDEDERAKRKKPSGVE